MPNTPNPNGRPLNEPDRGFRIFDRNEIYVGTVSNIAQYIPNKGDQMRDMEQGWFICVEVDYTTGFSTWEPWRLPHEVGLSMDLDILASVNNAANFVWLDTSIIPYRFSVDARMYIYPQNASYVKVFRGTDISAATGVVISRYYDQSGHNQGENIPLVEVALLDEINNHSISTVAVGSCTTELNNGEIVTLVVYDDVGGPISRTACLVQRSEFIRTIEASALYVTGISLRSQNLSITDDKTIEYPVNATVESNQLIGVVTYNNHNSIELPVDGTKFSISGLTNFIASEAGKRFPAVLTYQMGPDEFSNHLTQQTNRTISVEYSILTISVDNAYNVKLFAGPKWNWDVGAYRMEYWLYNLDRDETYYVTPYVQLGVGSHFDPVEYGVKQSFAVTINLAQINSDFNSYTHVQVITLTLHQPGHEGVIPRWTMEYLPAQTPAFGGTVAAQVHQIDANLWDVSIASSAYSMEDWLRRTYEATIPLKHALREAVPPTPTHFKLIFNNGYEYEYDINRWNETFRHPNNLRQGEILWVKFTKRLGSTDLQLAAVPFTVLEV